MVNNFYMQTTNLKFIGFVYRIPPSPLGTFLRHANEHLSLPGTLGSVTTTQKCHHNLGHIQPRYRDVTTICWIEATETSTHYTTYYTLWTDYSCILKVITVVFTTSIVMRAIIKFCLIPFAAHIIKKDRSSSRTKDVAVNRDCSCIWMIQLKQLLMSILHQLWIAHVKHDDISLHCIPRYKIKDSCK